MPSVTLLPVPSIQMPIRDNRAADDDSTRDVRAALLMGIPGVNPSSGSSPGEPVAGADGIAAALAILPANIGAPHVIQQFTSVFLVSRAGELWRVYDAEDLAAGERHRPTPFSTTPYRVFVALARKVQTRVYAFAPDASAAPRDLDPVSVQAQLDASVAT